MSDDLTLEEAADDIGLARPTLRQYVGDNGKEPRLPSHLRGNMRFVERADWEAWKTAYAAAPKRGRRGDGSVRRRLRRREYEKAK